MYPNNYQMGDLTNIRYSKQDYDMFRHTIGKCEVNGAPGYSTFGAQGYTICERWHTFANFVQDLTKIKNFQAYFYNRADYELSITNGAKEFNADNCEFVYKSSNNRSRFKSSREGLSSKYIGVSICDNNYQSTVTINGVKYYLGSYNNEIAAANMYNAIIFACTNDKNNLNEVEFMSVYECLQCRTYKTPIIVPPEVHIAEIDEYNASIGKKYRGVYKYTDSYMVQFSYNKTRYSYGSFDSPIAAANAYNWYATYGGNFPGIKLNDLTPEETMQAREWLNHRIYTNASKFKEPVKMIALTNESKEDRDKRCLERYGMIFE